MLTHLVKKASRVLMMQYRLAEHHLDNLLARVDMDVDLAEATGELALVRVSEKDLWRGRDVLWSANKSWVIGVIRWVLLNSMALREVADGSKQLAPHACPIWVPCPSQGFADMLANWLRQEVINATQDAEWPAHLAAEAANTVKVVSAPTMEVGNAWAKAFMKDPMRIGKEASIVIATYACQAGVSIDTHFRLVAPLMSSNIGTHDDGLQAIARVRDNRLGKAAGQLWPTMLAYFAPGKPTQEPAFGHYRLVADMDLVGQPSRVKEAYAWSRVEEQHLIRDGGKLYLKWFDDHDIPCRVALMESEWAGPSTQQQALLPPTLPGALPCKPIKVRRTNFTAISVCKNYTLALHFVSCPSLIPTTYDVP